ncbi:MAG: hypothetical protein IJI47_06820 [Eubacterium sp.]|nr:hypothetical protein [Eubacterium sp.]
MTDFDKQQLDINDINELISQFEASNHAERNRPRRPAEPLDPPAKSRTKREPKKDKKAREPRKVREPKKAREPNRVRDVEREEPAPRENSEKKEKKQDKKSAFANLCNVIAAVILVLVIVSVSGLTLFGETQKFSENENRNLAQKPKFSMTAVASGKFMQDTENYLSDQFVGRSALVKVRTAIDVFCGKREINGAYIGKDHYIFEKPVSYSKDTTKKAVDAINSFTGSHPDIKSYMAIVPNSSEILSEYMPRQARSVNQTEEIKKVYSELDSKIKTVDICTPFSKAGASTQLYYRTDHHWTTEAAGLAFKQVAKTMKLNTSGTKYETYPVTNSFQGTLSSTMGLFNAKDTISVTVPKTKIKYAVTYVSEQKTSASMFDSSKLSQKNKYEVFFGGNYSQVNIETTLKSDRVLMVVKDSYANCFVPMLYPYFKSVIMVDPRYYSGDIEQVIKKEGVTDVLWLYNANTFMADTSITGVFSK